MSTSIRTDDDIRQIIWELVELLSQRPITEEVAMRVSRYDGYKMMEIVNGDWVFSKQDEYMTGEQHGWIESLIVTMLTNWVLDKKAGRVYTGDTDFVLDGTPDAIRLRRQPDVAYVAQNRVQKTIGYFYGAPDLAVEIISPSQSRPEMLIKANEYLLHGTQQVWIVIPHQKTIEIHTADDDAVVLGSDDTLNGGDLLPQFTLSVKILFER